MRSTGFSSGMTVYMFIVRSQLMSNQIFFFFFFGQRYKFSGSHLPEIYLGQYRYVQWHCQLLPPTLPVCPNCAPGHLKGHSASIACLIFDISNRMSRIWGFSYSRHMSC